MAATYKLHYGGQEYKLDEAEGILFEAELKKFGQSTATSKMVTTTLHTGKELQLLLSDSIPVALEKDDRPNQTPTAMFL
ncbi:hypothetical protein [Nocardia farcinica]|uniref:hypothetical protein n=1 Tax=Nocardia farcinica TaxID=37329 RepID=UPI001E28A7C7|nr:hypothetical protein [Nocardia farcinica]UEX21198.1 hypothetical protein LMJ57_19550 [Nocardia farcinica]